MQAKIFTIGGFSGHAGQQQILDWLGHFKSRQAQIYLVHEYSGQRVLADLIREKFGMEVHIPDYLDECLLEKDGRFELTSRPSLAVPRIDWDYLLEETAGKLAQVQERWNICDVWARPIRSKSGVICSTSIPVSRPFCRGARLPKSSLAKPAG